MRCNCLTRSINSKEETSSIPKRCRGRMQKRLDPHRVNNIVRRFHLPVDEFRFERRERERLQQFLEENLSGHDWEPVQQFGNRHRVIFLRIDQSYTFGYCDSERDDRGPMVVTDRVGMQDQKREHCCPSRNSLEVSQISFGCTR